MNGGIFQMTDGTIQHAGDHWVVVPTNPDSNVIVINATGREVLRHCDGATPITMIYEHVAARFHTTGDLVRADIDAFLNDVTEAGIVEVRATT